MLGIGTVAEPVCIASTAWKCSTMSVCIERITQSSSAIAPSCGNSSLIIRPELPCGRNRNGDPINGRSWVSSGRRPNDGHRLAW